MIPIINRIFESIKIWGTNSTDYISTGRSHINTPRSPSQAVGSMKNEQMSCRCRFVLKVLLCQMDTSLLSMISILTKDLKEMSPNNFVSAFFVDVVSHLSYLIFVTSRTGVNNFALCKKFHTGCKICVSWPIHFDNLCF